MSGSIIVVIKRWPLLLQGLYVRLSIVVVLSVVIEAGIGGALLCCRRVVGCHEEGDHGWISPLRVGFKMY